MSTTRRRVALLGATVLTSVSVLAGCGLSSGAALSLEVGPGSIQVNPAFEDAVFTVGSKDFTENWLLGYMTLFTLSAAGAEVRDLTNIQGSNSARDAQAAGQIDMMWEYTGTSWISYNGKVDPITDAVAQYDAVAELDRREHQLVWTAMSPVDNTYAFALNRENAERLGVETLSDLAALVNEDPSAATFCVETEFASRNDGMPGVEEAYGFSVPPENLNTLAIGPIYQATADGEVCTVGEIFSTDGRVLGLDLVVLEDDRLFFPRYNASVVVREEVIEEYPEVREVLDPVAEALNNDVMRELNAKVDVEGQDPDQVARDWLIEEGFVTAAE
ncbi:osmoprotectant transport system substrate-binding protein [Actinoalloteichus hoggarensis]|uniref:Putative osmoprotectant uptake system substrate-binding protein OsmF n=1 Tax=Actinoalloteichus hoggarensis TaxID=1470176 RepID=A0A221VWW1_9PSEU|nr:glycine betaine ABC transporter substrate-binding protein [Actinoalloteichus hoggarensis]ASO17731.1 Putative osmoprotectant uptake system substrate-binding protein OsmF precursor [Actinoalloteichus hoggarensis]MBB5922857.1 osmoprotectant transport system substrate-binding protein [Actinoalloteichus hoggarensis]